MRREELERLSLIYWNKIVPACALYNRQFNSNLFPWNLIRFRGKELSSSLISFRTHPCFSRIPAGYRAEFGAPSPEGIVFDTRMFGIAIFESQCFDRVVPAPSKDCTQCDPGLFLGISPDNLTEFKFHHYADRNKTLDSLLAFLYTAEGVDLRLEHIANLGTNAR